jgi:glycerophosphoryl diester phosphodiesterase
MLIETKHISANGIKLEAATITAIKKFGLDNHDPTKPRAALMSFSISALRRAKSIDPDLYTVFLLAKKLPALDKLSSFVGSNAWGLGVHLLRTNPELVEQARSSGIQVFVWTVNTPEQIELCLKYKVDVIITDNPAATNQTIARLAAS